MAQVAEFSALQDSCDRAEGLDENALFEGLSRLKALGVHEALWLGKPAPRYTSYPPATAFVDTVGPDDYARALASVPRDEVLSLYLHVPFCRSLCLYCGCNTTVTNEDDRIDAYLSALAREVDLVGTWMPGIRRLGRIHVGGGSPNVLAPHALDRLFSILRRSYSFAVTEEVAVELDPRLVTREQIAALVGNGVTRVSLGVQDFNPDVQRVIRREQPYENIAAVCSMLREAGVSKINFDLIYGLPLQTPQSMAETARLTTMLRPDRIAVYSYAHVPQIKKHQRSLEASGLPGKHTLLSMESSVRAVLLRAGYAAVGMDHFALPGDSLADAAEKGTLRRNFQGYTDDAAVTLIGVGASSISRTAHGYFQNEREPRFYQKTMEQDRLATVRGAVLGGGDRLRAAIIESLMTSLSCDLDKICRAHGFSTSSLAPEIDRLAPFVQAGLISCNGFKIRMEIPHRMAIRVIAQIFDEAASPNAVATTTG